MKSNKLKIYSFLVSIVIYILPLFSEVNINNEDSLPRELQQRVAFAMSSNDYKVTAGDVYSLAYAAGNTPVLYQTIVDSTYKLRVSNLAVLDVKGKTFLELKTQVEQIISKNYPMSGVQFVLKTPSEFKVLVKGEVKNVSEVPVWALSRLSSVVGPLLNSYSSNRDIKITSQNGSTIKYDIFKAKRLGDLSQDPYLRPGDVITVNRVNRSITIRGAVERPGTYQLLEGEELKELIEFYASGLSPLADVSRIELVRYIDGENIAGNKIYLKEKNIKENYKLSNYDSLTVNEISDLIPVMFIEGAVSGAKNETHPINPEATNRLVVKFNEGENYASLVRKNRSIFSSVSDTKNAYVIRGDKHMLININPMLYDASYYSEHFVKTGDVLVVPFRQYFVTVYGSVNVPGRYPYIPDRDWEYYIALAGGFNKLQNSGKSVVITDVSGKKQPKNLPITPETVIEAKTNSFLFYFNQYSPVILSTFSIVTGIFTIKALIGDN